MGEGNAYGRSRGIEAQTFVSDGEVTAVAVLVRSLRDDPADVTIVLEHHDGIDPSDVRVGHTNWRIHRSGVAWQGTVTPGDAQLCRYEVDPPASLSVEALCSPPRIVDVTPAGDAGPDGIVVEEPTSEPAGVIRLPGGLPVRRRSDGFETLREPEEVVTDRDSGRCERLFGAEGDAVAFSDLVGDGTDGGDDPELDLDLDVDDSLEA